MPMCKQVLVVLLGFIVTSTAWSAGPNLGQPAAPAHIAAWDISIGPDGAGLPAGSGTVAQGLPIYQAKCQACHGEAGKGGAADPIAGGVGSLATPQPVKTVAGFWPYATTLFDYLRRAMPVTTPQTLTNDELYALCAYILSIDKIVAADAKLDAKTLPKVKMPNRDGFRDAWLKQKVTVNSATEPK